MAGSFNTQDNPAIVAGTVTAGTVTAAIAAGMGLSEAFNVHDFSAEQYAAVGVFVVALWAIMIPTIFWIKSVAFAPSTVSAIVDQAQTDKATLLAEDPATAISEEAVEALAAPNTV